MSRKIQPVVPAPTTPSPHEPAPSRGSTGIPQFRQLTYQDGPHPAEATKEANSSFLHGHRSVSDSHHPSAEGTSPVRSARALWPVAASSEAGQEGVEGVEIGPPVNADEPVGADLDLYAVGW